jgi:hypothetical protein
MNASGKTPFAFGISRGIIKRGRNNSDWRRGRCERGILYGQSEKARIYMVSRFGSGQVLTKSKTCPRLVFCELLRPALIIGQLLNGVLIIR